MVEPESEGSGEVWSPGGGRGQRWRLSAVAGVEGSGSRLRVEAPQQHGHLLHRRHRVVVRPTACPDGTALAGEDQTQKQAVHSQTRKRGADTQTVSQPDTQTLKDIQTMSVLFIAPQAPTRMSHES